ncbi:MAG TPA: 1,4-dihydroxy-6-naphthoate synthase, partial [Trueperaceae bacterium]|nr:1,4-dihydroxy-6-naphthoate synthase [Trueperaceae bacterium]
VSAGSTPGGEGLTFDVTLADIEALNSLTASGSVDVAKVSYAAYGLLADEYVLLRSGGALGHGVGPLVVSRGPDLDLAGARVAIPGGRTTANLLLRLMRTDVELVEMRYDAIMPAVAAGSVDAGLIIHESRFTYQDHGLHSLLDLGAWWEGVVGHLVPLGAIVARRSLGRAVHVALNTLVRASLEHANARPEAAADYIKANAQEMAPDVRQRHIDLYVNEHSLDVGVRGEAAVRELLTRAADRGLFPAPPAEIFAPTELTAGATSLAGAGAQR